MIVYDISLDDAEGHEVLAEVDTHDDSVKLFPACGCDLEQQEYALENEAIKRAHESGPQEFVRWDK